MIVVAALKDITRNQTQLMTVGLSRTTLIRNMSVFIAHLESFSKVGDAKSAVCSEASRSLSRALDEVLEPAASLVRGGTETLMSASTTGVENNGITAADQPLLPAQDNLSAIDFEAFSLGTFDNLDLSTWINDIDWIGTSGNWTDF